MKNVIAKDIEFLNYQPDNYAFLNDTEFPNTKDFLDPPVPIKVNGHVDENSQRFHDTCAQFAFSPNVTIPQKPPFDPKRVLIVGNAVCASTCSLFSTSMVERQGIRTVIFGGDPGAQMEYKGARSGRRL